MQHPIRKSELNFYHMLRHEDLQAIIASIPLASARGIDIFIEVYYLLYGSIKVSSAFAGGSI